MSEGWTKGRRLRIARWNAILALAIFAPALGHAIWRGAWVNVALGLPAFIMVLVVLVSARHL
jgi:hypothetical protein